MNALLLIAGLGTRLKPYTEHLPKCLMPIDGIPLLSIWLSKLDRLGFDNIYLNLHYKAPLVESFLVGISPNTPVKTLYEPQLLGTAGTLKALLPELLDQELFFAHGDNHTDCDLEAFIQAHKRRPTQAQISLLSFNTDHPMQCGIVEKDPEGLLRGFHEKVANPPGNEASAATYCLSSQWLNDFRQRVKHEPSITDFSCQIMPTLIGKALVHPCNGSLIDIGTPQALLSLQNPTQHLPPPPQYIPKVLRAPHTPITSKQQLLARCQQWAQLLTPSR